MTFYPKISVITVVRNGEKYLESAIKSITEQTYGNLEYVVIDGNSSDNTVNIIKRYSDKISYWISEEDEGIYDAMNKGIQSSSGDWLLFINSDDYLISMDIIERAVTYLKECNSLIGYGKIIVEYPSSPETIYGSDWESTKENFRNVGMCIQHQATFHSRALFANNLFDTSFKIAGDYDLLLRYLRNHDAYYIPLVITKMRAVGVSHTVSRIKLLKENRRVQIKNKMYKVIPPLSWISFSLKVIMVDKFIRIFGIERKNKLKKLIGRFKG